MQQTATVSSHYTITTTSSDNTSRRANTGSTAAVQTVNSSNPQTSQSKSTYSQNLPLSPLGSSTLSSSTSTPPQSLFAPNIPSKSSWSSSATSVPQNWTLTTQATDGGGDGGNSSFNNASPGPSFSSTMQQTSTVPLHSTTTSTSPVNSTQGAMTSSTSVNQIQSTNLKTSQPRSTYPQNPPRSSSPSFICTSWFVKQEDCSKTCSNAGGTVKKTCECSSNSDAISERSVCENYGIKTTEMGKCKDLCRASGTNALGSLSWIVAVQCSLAMFLLLT